MLRDRLEGFFQLRKHGTDIATECNAGWAAFVATSYILLVNSQILSSAGLSANDAVIGTAVGSISATLVAGLLGNLPYVIAPAMGLNAYLAYGLVNGTIRLSLPNALACCLWASVALALLVLVGAHQALLNLIPSSVKCGSVIGTGLLIALIGMKSVALVVPNAQTLVELGDLGSVDIWLTLLGVIVISSLLYHQVRGAMLLGVLVISIMSWAVHDDWPKNFLSLPRWHQGQQLAPLGDGSATFTYMLPAAAALLFMMLCDVSGVMRGLDSFAKYADGKKEQQQQQQQEEEAGGAQETADRPAAAAAAHLQSKWGFLSASVGSAIASAMSCGPVVVYVESAAGIKEGGRTGLTAVVASLCFAVSLFLIPVLRAVPPAATAPVQILVGAMMLSEVNSVNWREIFHGIPAFLTLMMMPFTFSISDGLLFGCGASLALFFLTGRFLELLPGRALMGGGGSAGSRQERQPLLVNAPAGSRGSANRSTWQKVVSYFSSSDETQSRLQRHPSLLIPREQILARQQEEARSRRRAGGDGGSASIQG